jgi:hypothetical protein
MQIITIIIIILSYPLPIHYKLRAYFITLNTFSNINKKTAFLIAKLHDCLTIRDHLFMKDKFLCLKPFTSPTQYQILASHSGDATDTNRL